MSCIPIDLKRLKFSRFGSWMACAIDDRSAVRGVVLQTLMRTQSGNDIATFEPVGSAGSLPFTITCTPSCLTMATDAGTVRLCLAEPRTLRLRIDGDLRLRIHWNINENNTTPTASGDWRLIGWNLGSKFRTSLLAGSFAITGTQDSLYPKGITSTLAPSDGVAELALVAYRTEARSRDHAQSFAACVQAVEASFHDYAVRTPATAPAYASHRDYAAYVNWSATVEPEGAVTRTAALMSNNWMRNLWNWDTFFNVMALSAGQPDLAWESVLLFFEHQAEDGQLPGYINNQGADYTRPQAPMQGWALGWIRAHTTMLTRERIAYLYPRLIRLLEWWFTYRDDTGSGFPFVVFPSDTGWDHNTATYRNCPNLAPEVSAYLVQMMDTLAVFAADLDRTEEAAAWRLRADAFAARIVERFWDGSRFRCPHAYTGYENPGDSLYNYRPVILGERLPSAVRDAITVELQRPGRFLTPYGLATESLASESFVEDGYWRGAIWAPTTLLFVDGLRRAGKSAFAQDLARRFCAMCCREGFPENFSAVTGKALRDPAYTWTSSVFLILATHYAE